MEILRKQWDPVNQFVFSTPLPPTPPHALVPPWWVPRWATQDLLANYPGVDIANATGMPTRAVVDRATRMCFMTAQTCSREQWQALFAQVPRLVEEFPFFTARVTDPQSFGVPLVEAFPVSTTNLPNGRVARCEIWVVNLHLGVPWSPFRERPRTGAARILDDGLRAELPALQAALADVYESVARDLGERLMTAYEEAKK